MSRRARWRPLYFSETRSSMLPPGVRVFERGWLSSNNVLLVGDGPATLIDSGYCTHAAQTLALLKDALQGRPLELLLNTHLHSDHCGGNAALQDEYANIQTLVPSGLFGAVREWDPWVLSYEPTGQSCPRFAAEDMLRADQCILIGERNWEVHAAPGHDPHALIFFEPQSRTLISADALWASGFGVVFPELEGEDAFGFVAQTLDLIERLDPALVIPGHGPVFTEVANALAIARQKLDGFVKNPLKHARHSAKVLLKYKLLEQRRMSMDALLGWTNGTSHFRTIHSRWFGEQSLSLWIGGLISDLARSNALEIRNGFLIDA